MQIPILTYRLGGTGHFNESFPIIAAFDDRCFALLAVQSSSQCDRLQPPKKVMVAPDAVIERAMRHTSPETKRRYQLGMVEQVREAMEKANQQVYGDSVLVH